MSPDLGAAGILEAAKPNARHVHMAILGCIPTKALGGQAHATEQESSLRLNPRVFAGLSVCPVCDEGFKLVKIRHHLL